MKILTVSRQSLKSIMSNKGRSFLTVLGIVIGIGSVIALISLGNGVRAYITKQISSLGATTLMVTPGEGFAQGEDSASNNRGPLGGGGGERGGNALGNTSSLTYDDYNSLLDKKNSDIKSVAANVSGSAVYNNQRFGVAGVTPSLFEIRSLSIQNGRLFAENDVTNKAKVLVLGSDLANNLFGTDDPVGKIIQIQNDNYQVIGVLNKISESSFNNPNLNAYAPYSSVFGTLGTDKFNNFTIEATDQSTVDKAKTEIQNALLANHNIKDLKLADFSVTTPADLLSIVGGITGILTSLLAGIAAISLLVGGIGIMNIMLVSVTERTREIGLRKAVGAKTSDILVQFLIEAILLTIIGGVLGIGLGAALGRIAERFVGFAPIISNNSILLAVGISTAIGLIFGIYPAARAARLNPIDALRYE
jgi:putative ABC transport system permease protein